MSSSKKDESSRKCTGKCVCVHVHNNWHMHKHTVILLCTQIIMQRPLFVFPEQHFILNNYNVDVILPINKWQWHQIFKCWEKNTNTVPNYSAESNESDFISAAQYHIYQFCLEGFYNLYKIKHLLSLNPRIRKGETQHKQTGKRCCVYRRDRRIRFTLCILKKILCSSSFGLMIWYHFNHSVIRWKSM